MRFGISSTLAKDRNITELINHMKDADIEFIEIRCERIHLNYEDKFEIKNLKCKLKEYDIKTLSIHPPDWIDIGSENEHIRMKSIREAQKCILVAHHLNSERIILHPSNSKSKFDIVTNSIQEIKSFADDWGKEILIENTFNPKSGSSMKELKDLANILNLNICFDTSHYFSNNNEYTEIKIIKEKISEIHLSDSLMDGKDDHLFPGDGKIDWGFLFNSIDLSIKDIIIELMPSKDIKNILFRINEFKKRVQDGNFS